VTTESIDLQLRHNSLGLPELVFQGVTHIAPATNMVFAFPIIALKAGPDMPLAFLLATIVCFFIGNTVAQFSRYMPSSGGYYSFATRGLGGHAGFMAAWSYLIYDLVGPAGSTGFLGYLIADMLRTGFGLHIPWWLIALVAFGVIWIFTHHGIQLSTRVAVLLGGLELLIMLSLAVTFLVHPGPGSNYLAPVDPALAPGHLGGILAGMVFATLALSGFEGPAPLAQESRRAGKFVSQAVILSLAATGAFYIFTSYASAIGWGTGDMAEFAAHPNPYYALGHALWGVGWWLVVLALINSAHAHVRDRFPADSRHRCGAAGRSVVKTGIHFRLTGDHRHVGGHRALLHGEFGSDVLHPAGASEQLQHLASPGLSLDCNTGAVAGLVRHDLSRAHLALQDSAVFICGGAYAGFRLYAVARSPRSRCAPQGSNDAGGHSRHSQRAISSGPVTAPMLW
jgi:hypothetical protein